MRLVHFDGTRLGVITDDGLKDVTHALSVLPPEAWPPAPGDRLISSLSEILAAVRQHLADAQVVDSAGVFFGSFITSPSKVMAAPANYRKHLELDLKDPGVDQGVHTKSLEGVQRPVETYGLFLKATSSIVRTGSDISLALADRRTDHEIELCVVIGRTARNVPVADAMDYVAGYMLGLDLTVRGVEDRSFRKSADGYTVLGPEFVTADEVADPGAIEFWLSVNGNERQRSLAGAMTVSIPELISFASSFYTLHPGDVIMTGTPEGVGPLQAGDDIVYGGTGLGQGKVRISTVSP